MPQKDNQVQGVHKGESRGVISAQQPLPSPCRGISQLPRSRFRTEYESRANSLKVKYGHASHWISVLLEQLGLPTLSAGGTKLHGLKAKPTQLCWCGTSRQIPLGLRALGPVRGEPGHTCLSSSLHGTRSSPRKVSSGFT